MPWNYSATLNITNHPEPRGCPLRVQDLRPRARDPRTRRVQEPLLPYPRRPGDYQMQNYSAVRFRYHGDHMMWQITCFNSFTMQLFIQKCFEMLRYFNNLLIVIPQQCHIIPLSLYLKIIFDNSSIVLPRCGLPGGRRWRALRRRAGSSSGCSRRRSCARSRRPTASGPSRNSWLNWWVPWIMISSSLHSNWGLPFFSGYLGW